MHYWSELAIAVLPPLLGISSWSPRYDRLRVARDVGDVDPLPLAPCIVRPSLVMQNFNWELHNASSSKAAVLVRTTVEV